MYLPIDPRSPRGGGGGGGRGGGGGSSGDNSDGGGSNSPAGGGNNGGGSSTSSSTSSTNSKSSKSSKSSKNRGGSRNKLKPGSVAAYYGSGEPAIPVWAIVLICVIVADILLFLSVYVYHLYQGTCHFPETVPVVLFIG